MSDKQITGDDACNAIHAALRKCCDSTPTSLLWNIVHAFTGRSDDAWSFYGELVAHYLADGRPPVGAMKNAAMVLGTLHVMSVPEALRDRLSGFKGSTQGGCALGAIRLAFELFSDQDWEGAASCLE